MRDILGRHKLAADSDHSKTFSIRNSHVAKNADEVQLWLCTSVCFRTWSLCLRSKQTSHTQTLDCGPWYICISCINQIRFEHISFQRSLLWNCLHAGSTGALWCSDFLSTGVISWQSVQSIRLFVHSPYLTV